LSEVIFDGFPFWKPANYNNGLLGLAARSWIITRDSKNTKNKTWPNVQWMGTCDRFAVGLLATTREKVMQPWTSSFI